jgi:arginase family enzyme
VWEAIIQEKRVWTNPEDLTLLIGGDCSIMIATAGKFYQRYKQDTHILVIDAHIDDVEPKPDVCVGAAAMGLWLLTNDNVFWNEKVNIPLPQITVMGCSGNNSNFFPTISLNEIKEKGASAAAQRYLADLPKNAAVLLHFDVDVIDRLEMNAAYAPAAAGLSLQETKELLQPLLADSRIRFVEVTEFSGLRDPDGKEASKIVKLLTESFSARIVQHV